MRAGSTELEGNLTIPDGTDETSALSNMNSIQEGDEIDGIPVEEISVSSNGIEEEDDDDDEVKASLGFVLGIAIPLFLVLLALAVIVLVRNKKKPS